MPTSSLKALYDDLQVSQGPERMARTAASEDPFILKLTQLVLSYGVQIKASDIHIEPTSTGARLRYRIDGILHEMLRVPPETRDLLLRSMKVKASMTTDVIGRSKPQDGRIDFEVNGRQVDLRLSSLPTLFGDVLAIRVLDRSVSALPLEQVGFPPTMLKEFERLIWLPNGLILVTGPAGSGKTTTLYAALNRLKSPRIKIVTLEDPIEYQMDGIDQSQINPAVGLTFASGLRAILRQDANVILVGEIRDQETADITIRAALTGHLVLATMHTRNTLGATSRLIDMGLEPYLVLSSITGVVAQRLVRALCAQCTAPDPPAAAALERLWARASHDPLPSGATVNRGAGCATCHHTGYQGRLGIFELLQPTEELKQLILAHSPEVFKTAVASGALQIMLKDGLSKVAQGLTTIEEVLRVTGERDE